MKTQTAGGYDADVLNVVERILGDGTFQALSDRIRQLQTVPASPSQGVVSADGLWGSYAPILAGCIARHLGRPLLYVTAHLEQADEARDDLDLFLGQTSELLSAFESTPGQGAASDEIHAERLALCARLLEQQQNPTKSSDVSATSRDRQGAVGRRSIKPLPDGRGSYQENHGRQPDGRGSYQENHGRQPDGRGSHSPLIVIAPVQALMQAVPTPEALEADMLTLAVDQHRPLHELTGWLADHGYSRLDQVESPGDFALRGDILDIYPAGEADPFRIGFFDDRIESIRRFDISTQRSDQTWERIRIASMPALAAAARSEQASLSRRPPPGSDANPKAPSSPRRSADHGVTSFMSYLPADTLVAIVDPPETQELGRTFWNRLMNPRGVMPVERLFQRAADFTQVHLLSLGGSEGPGSFHFGVRSLTRFETKTPEALQELNLLAAQRDVLLYCDSVPEQERFRELWQGAIGPWPERLELAVGMMHHGFDWVAGNLAVLGHHEIFHRYQQRRKLRRTHAARPLESWLDLNPGDFVVHVVHGIGRFLGLRTMTKGASKKSEEFLVLEFADKAKMYVPVSQIELVQKYIGSGATAPTLSKLGGTRWAHTKERVEEAVGDLAADLLRIQALRASQPGIAFPDDTIWQREFEGSFVYTETEDQLTCLTEVKRDMRKDTPMDRLLCGDVGYGKTELAIRAAFKAAEYGKQVAVLVPTTVLAEQHERTFRERFADYPFAVESISRFKTAKEQRQIIERARKGQVDILIGTHRLLSKDVSFADLGLLIIDEEQRFGVEHKEQLKRFRETLDVLTLTATPIPRTLHMSLLGIRDISSLATPPMDRRSIVTQVSHWDEEIIRQAIVRELNREGQVFFVHNFVHDIQTFADNIHRIVPEARILVGHGQMREHQLEKVMLRFVRHEADVLICTTIIESGLDIPNCNTILIDKADRFGLSELHQLRGRVGRYKHRAYCYLFMTPGKPLTATAARRLKAIEEFSDLGAGFRIAMRDLEIRGAGNILGAEQSGHIAAVGYELYCQLLENAVRRLKNEPPNEFRPVHLELDVPAHIPRNYVESERQRMEIYRRVVRCRTQVELAQLETDLRDAFGPPPAPVETLLSLAEIRVLAQPYRITCIQQQQPDLVFTVEELARVEPLLARSPGSARMADAHTVHLRLSESYFEPATLLAVLRQLLRASQTPHTIAPQ